MATWSQNEHTDRRKPSQFSEESRARSRSRCEASDTRWEKPQQELTGVVVDEDGAPAELQPRVTAMDWAMLRPPVADRWFQSTEIRRSYFIQSIVGCLNCWNRWIDLTNVKIKKAEGNTASHTERIEALEARCTDISAAVAQNEATLLQCEEKLVLQSMAAQRLNQMHHAAVLFGTNAYDELTDLQQRVAALEIRFSATR
jgi:hypothetical protein